MDKVMQQHCYSKDEDGYIWQRWILKRANGKEDDKFVGDDGESDTVFELKPEACSKAVRHEYRVKRNAMMLQKICKELNITEI